MTTRSVGLICSLQEGHSGDHVFDEVASLPVHLILHCPLCHMRHVDKGEFATKLHHTHACQHCGMVWRPAVVPTVGVAFLPGFKDVPHGA